MPNSLHPLGSYRFGVFEFEPHEGELRKHGIRLPVRKQPLQVLAALLQRHEKIVTREELHRTLWPGDTFVDFDHSLNNAINRLREALNDSASDPQFIETVPRRGYRFLGPIEFVPEANGAQSGAAAEELVPSAANTSTVHAIPKAFEGRVPARWKTAWIAGLAVAVLVAASYLAWGKLYRHWWASPEHIQIGVMPFENLTGNPADDYICDGLTEEMIAQLSAMDPSRLAVIARTSAMHYKGSAKTAQQIGKELAVDYLLESSVRRSGERLRITSQLIDIRTQTHLWAANYDRDLGDVLDMHRAIALAVGREIQLQVSPQVQADLRASRGLNPQAHELYLRGRYSWNQRSLPDLQRAIGYFEQAIALDPTYARAYSGLADSYALVASSGGAPYKEAYPKAGEMARKALQLDEGLAEAHTSLAFVEAFYDWKFADAEREFQRAIALNSSYVTAHHWYGLFLSLLGRHTEAIHELQIADRLDPVSIAIGSDLGDCYRRAGEFETAIKQYRRVLELDSNYFRSYREIAVIYAREHKFTEAESENARYKKLAGQDVGIEVELATEYVKAGQTDRARALAASLLRKGGWRSPCSAQLYVILQENDKALTCLEQGFALRADWMVNIKSSPDLESLHNDPRFQDLIRRMGFPN